MVSIKTIHHMASSASKEHTPGSVVPQSYRVGQGFDCHRTVANRPLVLGGVEVPAGFGLAGHSDADVLLHAVSDALLGACAAGDIGTWFPDTDPAYCNADSRQLLKTVLRSSQMRGWAVVNLDATVIAEQPKLSPHIPAIRSSLAGLLDITQTVVSVKAKTAEGLGPIGEGKALEARVVVLLETRD